MRASCVLSVLLSYSVSCSHLGTVSMIFSVRRCVHFTSFGTIRRECIFEAGRSDTLI
ncbi:hypothetical protein M758_1G281800 [Ceratodon purpureus]|nr:hypothetical protein M758_1G281800 [Ceratodon purpureus]